MYRPYPNRWLSTLNIANCASVGAARMPFAASHAPVERVGALRTRPAELLRPDGAIVAIVATGLQLNPGDCRTAGRQHESQKQDRYSNHRRFL